MTLPLAAGQIWSRRKEGSKTRAGLPSPEAIHVLRGPVSREGQCHRTLGDYTISLHNYHVSQNELCNAGSRCTMLKRDCSCDDHR